MSILLKLIIGSFTVAACAGQAVPGQHIATISPVRKSYVEGEPIDLTLTLRNESDTSATIESLYGRGVITFTAHGSTIPRERDVFDRLLAQQGRPRGRGAAWEAGGLSRLNGVEPRRSWSDKILLQDFVGAPGPGECDLNFTIDIPARPRGGQQLGAPFRGSGAFKITIVKGTDAELSNALARHARPGDDYWSGQSMSAGVVLVKSPVVVPYLTRIAAGGDVKPILAMARFPGHHDAEAFVIEKLTSEDGREVLGSLAVLQEWKYVLPEHEVRRLLNLPNALSAVRVGAILYAASRPGDIYGTQVRALANDPDARVAAVAARAYEVKATDRTAK